MIRQPSLPDGTTGFQCRRKESESKDEEEEKVNEDKNE